MNILNKMKFIFFAFALLLNSCVTKSESESDSEENTTYFSSELCQEYSDLECFDGTMTTEVLHAENSSIHITSVDDMNSDQGLGSQALPILGGIIDSTIFTDSLIAVYERGISILIETDSIIEDTAYFFVDQYTEDGVLIEQEQRKDVEFIYSHDSLGSKVYKSMNLSSVDEKPIVFMKGCSEDSSIEFVNAICIDDKTRHIKWVKIRFIYTVPQFI